MNEFLPLIAVVAGFINAIFMLYLTFHLHIIRRRLNAVIAELKQFREAINVQDQR